MRPRQSKAGWETFQIPETVFWPNRPDPERLGRKVRWRLERTKFDKNAR